MKPHFILKLRAKLNYRLEPAAYLLAKVNLRLHPRSALKKANLSPLGHGDHQYAVDTEWAKVDANSFPVKNCHEMVIDMNGRIILLTDHAQNNILIFDREGELLESWTLGLKTAHGLSIGQSNGEEYLIITDFSSGRVVKTSLTGEVLLEFPTAHDLGIYSNKMPYDPTETAVAPNGDVYVADGYGSYCILQFSSDGEYIRHFGGKGKEDKHLNNPHGIVVDTRNGHENQLVISSRMQSCFKRFSLEGDYLSTINLPGSFPCRPVIHGEHLYAAICWSKKFLNPNSGFVIVMDNEDRVVSCVGGIPPLYENGELMALQQQEKLFYHCHDVCVDDDSNIYVCQWNAQGVYPYKLTAQK